MLNNSVTFSGREPRSSIFLAGWKSLLGKFYPPTAHTECCVKMGNYEMTYIGKQID